MKRIMRLFLSCLLTGISLIPALAEENTEEMEPVDEAAEETAEETYDVEVETEAAVLIDADSGKVLFQKNMNQEMDPASLTKLMTVYLSALNLQESQILTMTSNAYQTYDHNSSVLWVVEGETMSALDAMNATLLASANDTCAMLVEAAGSTQTAFLKMMKDAAAKLDMKNTNFDNVYGVYSEHNYSSAYDLAILTRAGLKNSVFRNAFTASSYTIGPTNKMDHSRVLPNDCELVRDGSYQYEYAVGGKIGYTAQSGYALAASASKDGTSLIAVVLGESTSQAAYEDAVKLFEYGFENYRTVTIAPEQIGEKTVEVYSGRKHTHDVVFTVNSGFSILLPASQISDIVTLIEVENESSADPEEISARICFMLDDAVIGYSDMEKEILDYTVTGAPEGELLTLFDYISIGVMGFMLFLPLLIKLENGLQPPKE